MYMIDIKYISWIIKVHINRPYKTTCTNFYLIMACISYKSVLTHTYKQYDAAKGMRCVILYSRKNKYGWWCTTKKNKIKHKSKIAAFEIKWCEAIWHTKVIFCVGCVYIISKYTQSTSILLCYCSDVRTPKNIYNVEKAFV